MWKFCPLALYPNHSFSKVQGAGIGSRRLRHVKRGNLFCTNEQDRKTRITEEEGGEGPTGLSGRLVRAETGAEVNSLLRGGTGRGGA